MPSNEIFGNITTLLTADQLEKLPQVQRVLPSFEVYIFPTDTIDDRRASAAAFALSAELDGIKQDDAKIYETEAWKTMEQGGAVIRVIPPEGTSDLVFWHRLFKAA